MRNTRTRAPNFTEPSLRSVNFKKLRPRAPLLKESKVFQELQQEANSEPAQLRELNRRTTFLRKPDRPVPKPRRICQSEQPEPEPYRVLIEKQPKKSVTERLLERGILDLNRRAKTPEVNAEPVILEPSETGEDGSSFEMLPINEEQSTTSLRDDIPAPRKRQRLCRRGRYLSRALESLGPRSARAGRPRLLRRPRYFERIVGGLKRSVGGAEAEDSLIRLLMLASLACSIRETYDAEILHRGSSRRNSRRASSSRRDSSATSSFESGILAFEANKEAESLESFGRRCAEGRRRLSVMSMMVADKVGSAMRTDLARGLAYAVVPCASALAFFMFNYAKRYNDDE